MAGYNAADEIDDELEQEINEHEAEIQNEVEGIMYALCPSGDFDYEDVDRVTELLCRFLAEGIGLLVYRPRIINEGGVERIVEYPYNENVQE